MLRSILHCDMNNFYASVECMLDPALKKYPIAVCGSVEERHGIVLAKNYKAKAFDVKTGDAVWQANDLASQRPLIASEWSERNYPLKPNMVTVFANRKVGIGVSKIKEISNQKNCPFVLWNGTKRLIKRKQFEDYLETQYSV